jgi:hypothetical protein
MEPQESSILWVSAMIELVVAVEAAINDGRLQDNSASAPTNLLKELSTADAMRQEQGLGVPNVVRVMVAATTSGRWLYPYHGVNAEERAAALRRVSERMSRTMNANWLPRTWDVAVTAAMLRKGAEAMLETSRIISPEWRSDNLDAAGLQERMREVEPASSGVSTVATSGGAPSGAPRTDRD